MADKLNEDSMPVWVRTPCEFPQCPHNADYRVTDEACTTYLCRWHVRTIQETKDENEAD